MSTQPRVSVIVVSYESRDDLARCLASVERHLTLPHEVLVVDNASRDGSAEAAREACPRARVIANVENAGFGAANNQALREARAPHALLLNPDCELRPGAVAALLALLEARADVGAAAPRTLNPDGTAQVSFGPALGLAGEWRQRRLVNGVRRRDPRWLARVEALSRREHEPGWVSASCLLARTDALRAIGGFDERFFLYEEDVDLCLRLRAAGWRVFHTPAAEVVHHLGRSVDRAPARARLEYHRSHVRYYVKHNGRAQTAVLRALIAAEAVANWVGAQGPGAARRDRRATAAATLRIALRER